MGLVNLCYYVGVSKNTNFTIEIERELDGRWIAEVQELRGVVTYGSTRQEAVAKAEALALRVVADRLEVGERKRSLALVAFQFS